MPTYVYKCPGCKRTKEEKRHPDKRHDEVRCECGERMVLTIGKTSFLFKH